MYKCVFFCLLSAGLNVLYPGELELNNLLKLVVTEGNKTQTTS